MSTTEQRPHLKVGSHAPDFILPDQNGSAVHLADELAKHWVVLFFYPKDHSPICTSQACAFRNAYEDFRAAGAEILGISSDSIPSHASFARQSSLPFRLLSDERDVVRKLYGVPKTLGLLPGRVTYVINPQGEIRLVYPSPFFAQAHMEKALALLKREARR